MKKTLFCIIILTLLLCTSVVAMAEEDENYRALDGFLKDIKGEYRQTHNNIVIGVSSAYGIGSMTRNSFNYPTNSWAVTPFLGVDIRRITNLPSEEEVCRVAEEIFKENPNVSQRVLREWVIREARPSSFKYFQYGTEFLLIPKIGMGSLYPLDDECNFLFDVGVQFPLLLNFGLIISF
jgi:hypothetical protein